MPVCQLIKGAIVRNGESINFEIYNSNNLLTDFIVSKKNGFRVVGQNNAAQMRNCNRLSRKNGFCKFSVAIRA